MPETPVNPDLESRPAPRGTQRVRIDEGSGSGPDLAPGRGSLLRAFGGWGRRPKPAPADERRAEPRHDRLECQAWVGWKSIRRFHMSNALVINLSRGGAQIFLDTLPPPETDLWIYLETPGQNAVVEARVLEIFPTPGGQCLVRVAFREPCPFVFFEAAVCGLTATDPKNRLRKALRVLVRGPQGQ